MAETNISVRGAYFRAEINIFIREGMFQGKVQICKTNILVRGGIFQGMVEISTIRGHISGWRQIFWLEGVYFKERLKYAQQQQQQQQQQ